MPPKRKHNKAIPEEDVLSDDEPKTITLTKEQRLTSKFIIIDCPICHGKIQLKNEIQIDPKGIKCSCNPCSFKLSKNDKTMNVSRDNDGDIVLDCQDHSISFSWNRNVTPESEDEQKKYQMISDVMKHQGINHHQILMRWIKKCVFNYLKRYFDIISNKTF